MGSPCPPHWSFAARAAYFGDRLCAFCDHRNPPGSNYCNDCAAPLHLKPCGHCNATNEHFAAYCHECGGAYPVPVPAAPSTSALAGDSVPAQAAPGEVSVRPPAADVVVPALPPRAGRRVPTPRAIAAVAAVAAVVAVGIVVAVAHHPYRDTTAGADPVAAAPQSRDGLEPDVGAATPVAAAEAESTAANSEAAAQAEAGSPSTDVAAPQRTGMRRAPPPAAGKVRANAHQRAETPRRAPSAKPTPAPRGVATARVGSHETATRIARPADRSHVMQASLGDCGSPMSGHVACNPRTSGFPNDHGQ